MINHTPQFETPRTDEAWDDRSPLKKLSDEEKKEFARTLEHELGEAKAKVSLDGYRALGAQVAAALDERDEARLALSQVRGELVTLENFLAEELGIEKALPECNDEPGKEYWIGIDQRCYESQRAAIDAAMKGRK